MREASARASFKAASLRPPWPAEVAVAMLQLKVAGEDSVSDGSTIGCIPAAPRYSERLLTQHRNRALPCRRAAGS